jgi:hypothetical protein
VEQAVMDVGDYRSLVAEDVRREVGQGVVGRVESQGVSRREQGAFTAMLSLTVIGCPDDERRRDPDLDFLARTALTRIAQNLATVDVDAFQAALWYEGLMCSRHSLGYGATWTRTGNKLTLRR